MHKTKRPMDYRRRTTELARRDKYQYQLSVYNENNWKNDWTKSIHVRVKVIGKRVLFLYDEEFVRKNWVANKKKRELKDKIRELKEQKFKSYSKKILKLRDDQGYSDLNTFKLEELMEEWAESSEELNEGR